MIKEIRAAAGISSSQIMYEYMLVAAPGGEAEEKVVQEKEQFCRQYHQPGKPGRPHIMVASFLAHDEMEDTLLRWLQRISGEQKGFAVTLDNYGGFPPHTIFLRVLELQKFRTLADQLRPIDFYIKSNGCPPARFITYPYLGIARELAAPVYEKAMEEYRHKVFQASFQLTELLLLRRQYAGDACRQVAVLRLQPGDQRLFAGPRQRSLSGR